MVMGRFKSVRVMQASSENGVMMAEGARGLFRAYFMHKSAPQVLQLVERHAD
jgi:hypothetical protein